MSKRSSYNESNESFSIPFTEDDAHDAFDRVKNESKNIVFKIFIFFFKNTLRTIVFFFTIGLLTAVGFNPSWARATSKFFSALVVGDLIEAGKAAGEVDLSESNHQSLKDLAREAGYVTSGQHPFIKQLEVETGETYWSEKFAYVGNGLAMMRTPVTNREIADDDNCDEFCDYPASFATKENADDHCADKYQARVPNYEELSKALRNKVTSIHMSKYSDYPEWTSSADEDETDDFKILYKDQDSVLLEGSESPLEENDGRPAFIDDDDSYYNLAFRCVLDVKIVAIQE